MCFLFAGGDLTGPLRIRFRESLKIFLFLGYFKYRLSVYAALLIIIIICALLF